MRSIKKRMTILMILCMLVLFTACDCDGEDSLINIPSNIVNWLFGNFTGGFWENLSGVWAMPWYFVWLAGPVAYILGAALYVIFVVLVLVFDLVLAVLIGVIWFLFSIFGACISC